MMLSTSYWFHWLVSLVSIYVWFSMGMSILLRNSLKELPGLRPKLKRLKAIRLVPKLVFAFFFFVLGFACRDLMQFHRTFVLSNVKVLSKDTAQMYRMQTDNGQTFEFKFCDDFIPDLDSGTTLKTIVYEDRGACKSIASTKLGYLVTRGFNGQPIYFAKGD